MPAKITLLIDKSDNAEIIRDLIGAILVLELDAQQVLAEEADKDPNLWKLRIFTGRACPWEEFRDNPEQGVFVEPIVNISWASSNFEERGSSVVNRIKTSGTFNIDCYGSGVSTETAAGHSPGDAKAEFEAARAARLVRNILMSAHYVHLGMTGTVGKRWVQSIKIFEPSSESRPAPHVVGARVALEVQFNEFSPQVQGETLELVSVQVKRTDTGELLVRADYEIEE